MPSRSEHIKTELDEHFMNVVGIAVSTPAPDAWRSSLVESLGAHAQFGWSWPIRNDDPPISVPYCPEIIDEQTAELSDEELDAYLLVIKHVCQTHILLWTTEADPDTRQAMIWSQMYDESPASLSVWNRVQLAALGPCRC